MAKKHSSGKRRPVPTPRLRLPDLDQAKSAVLNSLSSHDAQRGYTHAIDEFIEWYCSEPRLSFNRTVVLRYRIYLESRGLAPGMEAGLEWPNSVALDKEGNLYVAQSGYGANSHRIRRIDAHTGIIETIAGIDHA